jgi:hypothetical protein
MRDLPRDNGSVTLWSRQQMFLVGEHKCALHRARQRGGLVFGLEFNDTVERKHSPR